MAGLHSHNDRGPITTVGNLPVYAATVIAAAIAASLIVCSLMMAANISPAFLAFESSVVLHGQFWRVFTYPLLNPPSFYVVVDIFLVFWFGREIEVFLGRRAFLRLYGILLLAPIPFLLAIPGAMLAGSRTANFAIFIAFAVIYPRVQIFFGIEARWIAIVYLAINLLQALAAHDWLWIVPMLICTATAYAIVRYEQGRWTFRMPGRRPKLRVIEGGKPATPQPTNVDAILEKISRSGIDSLTSAEREQLAKAREQLLRK